jgi:hypothetical protein
MSEISEIGTWEKKEKENEDACEYERGFDLI